MGGERDDSDDHFPTIKPRGELHFRDDSECRSQGWPAHLPRGVKLGQGGQGAPQNIYWLDGTPKNQNPT